VEGGSDRLWGVGKLKDDINKELHQEWTVHTDIWTFTGRPGSGGGEVDTYGEGELLFIITQ